VLCEHIFSAMHLLGEQRWSIIRTATVMPDHIHLLITLGDSAGLSEVVRLFKGRLSPALRASGLHWERGYFDHRLRQDEDRLPVFVYIFLNPYRAGLRNPGQTWPAYYCCEEDWVWFKPLTNEGCPFPEWLA
jgi:REP element-mobilizing transposase RayT